MDLPQVAHCIPRYHQRLVKSIIERTLAAIGLVAISPLLLLLSAVIRLESRGPAFHRQQRCGLNGKPFTIYKLRSMSADAEEASGAVWASEKDPRVTRVGSLLRSLHLDELPQLINIVKGEMAFVGPRPERPVFVKQLASEIPGYEHRLTVLPGVTGLAQINLDPDQTVDCVRRKLELDIQYIFTCSPTVDVRIVVCTLLKMVAIPRGFSATLMMVNYQPVVSPPSAIRTRRQSPSSVFETADTRLSPQPVAV